ncbi:MAG: NAD(P)-binding domain-containing protein, partial [Nitrososphaerales archaeon]
MSELGISFAAVTTILHEAEGRIGALDGQRVAVVGYGNQGRSWALNLRDSGMDTVACVRADETRDRAENDGFATSDVEAANDADVICI